MSNRLYGRGASIVKKDREAAVGYNRPSMRIPPALGALVGLAAVSALAYGSDRALSPGQRAQSTLAAGERHVYAVTLEAGQFVRLTVVPSRIDVAAKVVTPAGEGSPIDVSEEHFGDEPASLLAESSGTYRIEVTRNTQGATAGGYTLDSEPARPATGEDRSRFAAERALAEGARLLGAGQPDKALETMTAALPSWRTLGDRRREADTLTLIGVGLAGLAARRGRRQA